MPKCALFPSFPWQAPAVLGDGAPVGAGAAPVGPSAAPVGAGAAPAAAETALGTAAPTEMAQGPATQGATAPGGLDYDYGAQGLNYIPLHLHSDYSILDGLESVEAIVKQAAKLKIPALALTDLTNICGYIKFYNACRSSGIKPIMGADLMVEEPIKQGEEPRTFRLTVLAMDRVGKQNLYDLLSEAWLRSHPGAFDANTKMEELAQYSQGSPAPGVRASRALSMGRWSCACNMASAQSRPTTPASYLARTPSARTAYPTTKCMTCASRSKRASSAAMPIWRGATPRSST